MEVKQEKIEVIAKYKRKIPQSFLKKRFSTLDILDILDTLGILDTLDTLDTIDTLDIASRKKHRNRVCE